MRGNRSTAVSIPVSPYKHAGIHARYLAALAAVILTLWSAPPVMCAFINPPILHDELTYSLDGGSSYAHRGSAIWKNVAYLSGWPTDAYDPIYSIDVSDPDNLTYIGRSGGPGYYYNQMFPLEDKLYVAGWGEMLRDYSISNPGYPVYLGQYDRPCEPDPNNPGENICYFGWGVRAVDNRVYLTEASEKSKGLYIIDVSNPSGPTEVSRLELDESPGGIAARGSYLYFGYNHFGSIPAANYFSFKVANISDETNPYVISTINLTSIGSVGDIVLRGDIAYVSNNGITTIDISDPANPTVISHWDYVGGQLLLLGDYAFVATGGNGCIFVNIADPANMYGVYTVYHGSPREYEEAVVGNGRYVYVGTTSNKLVQDPPYNVLHSFEVFTSDPDNAGPGNCKEFSPREASWESQYDADVMPTAAGWTVHEGSEASASISSGVLRINDTGSGDVKWRKGWDATNTRGSTIVFKARCDSYNLNGQPEANLANVFIEDGKYQEQFAILTNKIRVCNATLDEAAVTPGVWHTYRITTQQGLFNLYIDENPTPAISRPLYETTPRSRIMFGVGSGAASQDISFDYFYYFSNGVFPPPQVLTTPTPDVGVRISEIAGKGSLSGINPTTARVHWSTDTGATWSTSILGALWDDHYGGTTLPSAATPVWTVAEGSESWATLEPGVAHVIDNSMASGSKIKWSRAWGITPSTGATVLARIKCDSVGGDMTYLGNIYVDDGVKHERFKVTPTSISAANSGYTYNLNATQWHTYRITIRNSQFKVYVDESPTAVLSASMIANTEGNGSRVMFGSGASAATQSIYFDYVRYTVDGEFTPGSGPSAATLAVACDGRDADDRCYISAGGLPLIYSKTRNKVKFSLMDKMGNIGYSPVYSLSILSPTAPGQVTNFSAVAGAGQISLSWTNPADPWFTGTMIRYKTSGYPTGPTDGTLLCDRSTAPGANDGYLHTGLGNNTYYYAAYSHDETPNYSSGTIASATPGCVAVWLDEIFDNYNNGNLGGQGAWTTTGAASAQAQSGYAESGKAALMDTIASGGAAIANRIAFDAKSGGYHYLTLDVSQDATGAFGQAIGYVSFQASDSSEIARLHVQKGRLMFEYGSGSYCVLTTTAANLTWYNVKIGFNIDTRRMDVWLDTTQKCTGIAFKGSGTNLAAIVIASDNNPNLTPQKLCIDNIFGEAKPVTVAEVRDDGAWTPSLSKLHFSFDPAPCAGEYRYAVGTTAGGTNVRGWTICGQATDVLATGLSLTQNQNYYMSVEVGTGNDTWGGWVSSNGIKVAPGVTIQEAKALADGTAPDTKAIRGKAVSAVFPGFFYVQDTAGHSGIKILSPASVAAGDEVDVCGVMQGSDAERYLDCTGNPVMTTTPGPGIPPAAAMSAVSLGGTELNSYTPGVVGGVGTNNIGLHVTVFGNVTALGSGFFYLDDGSAPSDPRIDPGTGQPYVGVRILSSASVGLDEYWTATGVSTLESDSGNLIRTVRAANAQRMQ